MSACTLAAREAGKAIAWSSGRLKREVYHPHPHPFCQEHEGQEVEGNVEAGCASLPTCLPGTESHRFEGRGSPEMLNGT